MTEIPYDASPVMIIRLAPVWVPQHEELESGYIRSGHGWREGMTDIELCDSARAWWRFRPETLDDLGITHVVVVAAGLTRALYRIGALIGPRPSDGRYAFECTEETRGELFDAYVGATGKSVPYAKGAANPIRYWPPTRTPAA
jgi:hypothetical protein